MLSQSGECTHDKDAVCPPCMEEIILPMLTHEALNPSILIVENIISCRSDKLVYGLILKCMSSYVYAKLVCGPKGEIIVLII
jgi:hypothetical protein